MSAEDSEHAGEDVGPSKRRRRRVCGRGGPWDAASTHLAGQDGG